MEIPVAHRGEAKLEQFVLLYLSVRAYDRYDGVAKLSLPLHTDEAEDLGHVGLEPRDDLTCHLEVILRDNEVVLFSCTQHGELMYVGLLAREIACEPLVVKMLGAIVIVIFIPRGAPLDCLRSEVVSSAKEGDCLQVVDEIFL